MPKMKTLNPVSKPKMCCVPGCSNTWALTKYSVEYYRFPKNKIIKQKWLDAMNCSEKKTGQFHLVCGDHFNIKDLAALAVDPNAEIIPTIFSREFVSAIPSKPVSENIIKSAKRRKLKNDSLNKTSSIPKRVSKRNTDIQSKRKMAKSTIGSSIIEIESSEDETITQSNQKTSENQIKSTKSSKDQNNHDDFQPENTTTCDFEGSTQQSTIQKRQWDNKETLEFIIYMLKHKEEFLNLHEGTMSTFWDKMAVSLNEIGKMKQITTTEHICCQWTTLTKMYSRILSFDLDIDNVKFPYLNKMCELFEFLNHLVKDNKPNVYLGRASSRQKINDNLQNDFTLNGSSSNPKYINHDKNDGSSNTNKNELESLIFQNRKVRRHQWSDEDIKTFFNYIINHKVEFISLSKRKRKNFFQTMEMYLRSIRGVKQIAKSRQLQVKWKVFYKAHNFFPSDEVDPNKYPFIEQMKEILLDSLDSHSHAISVGLPISSLKLDIPLDIKVEPNLWCQAIINESINQGVATQDEQYPSGMRYDLPNQATLGELNTHNPMQLIAPPLNDSTLRNLNDELELNNSNVLLSTAELKKIYLQKKIEGQELKNKLLKRFLNDPNYDVKWV